MTDDLSLRDFGIDDLELDRDFHPEGGEDAHGLVTEELDASEEPLGKVIVPGGVTAPPGYELLHKVGEGGMGVVYCALQVSLDRTVAIKFLREGLLGVAGEDQFFGEARSMAKLRHPNVVQVYDAGSVEERPFLVMDLVEGQSFLEMLEASRGETGEELSIRRVFQLMAEACRGVDYCNRQGLVHCDINPRNIMVDETDTPYVMDFGIARALGTVTRDSVVDYGTPAYLAPERLRTGAVIDERTDVYALGAVLYYLVTGRHPFVGRNPRAVLRKVLDRSPLSPREINPRLSLDAETIIQKTMEKNPAERYANVEELRSEIQRYLDGEAITARRHSIWRRFLRFLGRHKSVVLVIVLAMGVLAGAGVYAYALFERARELQTEIASADEKIRSLRLAYQAELDEGKSEAAAQADMIGELQEERLKRRAEFEALRTDYLAQNRQMREILRQKDELLGEREALIQSMEEAQALAQEKMRKLAETSQEARRITTELDRARARMVEQREQLAQRESQLSEQADRVSAVLDEKREALAQAERIVEEEVAKETRTLLTMLDDDNFRTRLVALDKLGRRADPRTLQRIIKAARESTRKDRGNTVEVQVAAVRALGRFPEQEPLVPVYRALMKDPQSEVRLAVLQELARRLEPSGLALVIGRLDDSDAVIVVATIKLLSHHKKVEAASKIVSLLSKSDQDLGVLLAAADAVAVLASGSESAGRQVLPLLERPDGVLRATAAATLGAFPHKGVVRKLEALNDDPDARTRRNALGSLEAIARTPGIPSDVRSAALRGLVEFLGDPIRQLAEAADQALQRATGKTAEWRYAKDDAGRRSGMRKWQATLRR